MEPIEETLFIYHFIKFINGLTESEDDIMKFIDYVSSFPLDKNLANKYYKKIIETYGELNDIWLFLFGCIRIDLFELSVSKLKEMPIIKKSHHF